MEGFIRLEQGFARVFGSMGLVQLALVLGSFSSVIALALPRALNVVVRVQQPGGFSPVFLEAQMELRPNLAEPDEGYALLGSRGGRMRTRIEMSHLGLLLTERFHDALKENSGGFFLPRKDEKDRLFYASRYERDVSPGILVDMDIHFNVTTVGIWLQRQLPGQSGETQKDELWSLSSLAQERAWQRHWVFVNPHWGHMPDLIRGGAVQMQNYPRSMAYLIGLLSDPVSLDDIFFATEAAKLLGVSEGEVRKQAHIEADAPLKPIHWLAALEHRAAHRPAFKPPVITPQFKALSTKIGRSLSAIALRSERLRLLSQLLRSKLLRPDESATLRHLTEFYLGGIERVVKLSVADASLNDADYANAALAGSYQAKTSELMAAITGDLAKGNRHEKMQLLWKMLSDNSNSALTAAVMEITEDVLGGKEKVRELSDTDDSVLSPQHYQRALKVAFGELPEEKPPEFPGLTSEEEGFIGEWPEQFFRVDVETDDGRLKHVPGRLYLRGPNDHPLGAGGFFRHYFELAFKNSPKTMARRNIERTKLLEELWVARLPDRQSPVLWKEKNGVIHPADFMGILFVDTRGEVRWYFRLRVSVNGAKYVYRVDPEEVFPLGCHALLAQAPKHKPKK